MWILIETVNRYQRSDIGFLVTASDAVSGKLTADL